MAISSRKITDQQIASKGVVNAPDRLTGSATDNKKVFDRLIREAIKIDVNALIDDLVAATAAGELGYDDTNTALTANNIQSAIVALKALTDSKADDAATTAALLLKSDKSVTNSHYKAVSFNETTGVFTFTKEDGTTTSIDTLLEKIAINFRYDPTTKKLILTLKDGTIQEVSLSDLIEENEFVDSSTIDFDIVNHTVTASIKNGSITDAMLSSALVETLEGYVESASGSATSAGASATNAETYKNQASSAKDDAVTAKNTAVASAGTATTEATKSKSYAVGGTSSREGEDTDNAKYYKEQAQAHATGTVRFDVAQSLSPAEKEQARQNIGAGSYGGDMSTSIYDPNGYAQDIFAYANVDIGLYLDSDGYICQL